MSDAARDRGWFVAGLLVGCAAGAALLAEPGLSEHEDQRLALAVVGAALVGLRWAWTARRRALTLAVVLWTGLCLGSVVGSDVPRVVAGRLNPWSHYHYLINAKYFAELGYTRLYEQTLAADREQPTAEPGRPLPDPPPQAGEGAWFSPPPAIEVRRIRDLTSYELVPVATLPLVRDGGWSDARWAAFQADLAWFVPRLPWDQVLYDRGYNAPPTGNALYRQIARLPMSTRTLSAVGLLDPLLLALAFAVAGRVFGPVRALTAAAFVATFFGNEHRLIGSFLQYDYLAALVLAACAWRAARPATSGALLAYAAMVRVFPGVLVAGLAVWAAGRFRASGAWDRRVVRFAASFAAACAALAVVGCLSQRGPGAWAEWAEKAAVHADHHKYGERRIGLQHLFTYTAPEGRAWPKQNQRKAAWEGRAPAWAAAAALGVALWLAVGVRGGRRDDDPLEHLALALWPVFVGIVLSRYYWSAACLLILLGPGRDRRGDGELYAAGLLALVAWHYAASHLSNAYAQYIATNAALCAAWVAVLLRVFRRVSPPAPG